MKKAAFTLVELIVVITILAILATVGFVSFSSYLIGARDVNRLAQLKSISDGLSLYHTRKELPIPDDKVDILSGVGGDERVIAYQGSVGANVLETIEYSEKGLDPKDGLYFDYYLTKDKKFFQLLGFLEEPNEDRLGRVNISPESAFASDYSERYPIVEGKRLGVITNEFNTPINQVESVILLGSINIETTTENLIAHIDNESQYSQMDHLAGIAGLGGILSSCKSYIDKHPTLLGKDGYYLLFSKMGEIFPTYCDMTYDGGGWTLLLKVDGNESTFYYDEPYWENDETINEYSTSLDGIEYKSRLFSTMKFEEINLVVDTGGIINNQSLTFVSNSLKDTFNKGFQDFAITKSDWMGLVPGSSMQPYCNKGGLNVDVGSIKTRIGFSSNNENICSSNDSVIGIGLQPRAGLTSAAGNICGSTQCQDVTGGSTSQVAIKSLGYIYVR